ncbi:HI0074 family nucleotidyltransferase substrate-binding subunit [Fangia hongkongensis]|uniref:HI0074 family nucleotidyltransferase substrate-binding subunit n=1 Tax=Fangia hongkongensis TaxID=270495 RepID=UPI00146AC1E2|nr:HI0074 family nucleotidyltransferase substrate-binding subunit [Fangia hongkongensis]MBK2124761.1 nucleotidyltransferase substrate binding protein [Fangia hongkongensis]
MKPLKIFGLSPNDFMIMMGILHQHRASLKKVILFGSRARRDYLTTSDINLAIEFNSDCHLSDAFANSALSLNVDIVDLNFVQDKKIYQHILSDGIILLDGSNKEEMWMSLALLTEKLQDYSSALARLDEALEKDIYQDDMYLDATIQRFEFCYELCWKLMKAYLRYVGVEVNSPRSAFREAFKQGIIVEISVWLKMLDKRNLTSHTYHEDMAKEVYYAIKDDFYDLLDRFRDKISFLMEGLLKEEQ